MGPCRSPSTGQCSVLLWQHMLQCQLTAPQTVRGHLLGRHCSAPGSQVPETCPWVPDCSQQGWILQGLVWFSCLRLQVRSSEVLGLENCDPLEGRSSTWPALGPTLRDVPCSLPLRLCEPSWGCSTNPRSCVHEPRLLPVASCKGMSAKTMVSGDH